ncbi:hypothetical protein [Candidatus Formimonas warabiya]|nr:hypothetical protein [Candidatus Formimonas warabiya]
MTKKAIFLIIVASILLFSSGWLMGHSTALCKCTGQCCPTAQNIQTEPGN